jgi:hypothetical protein
MGSNPIPSIQFTGLYRSLLFFNTTFLCKFNKMITKKFLDFPQTTVKETLQLSNKDYDIKELKRKIDSIIKYQKPYISKTIL